MKEVRRMQENMEHVMSTTVQRVDELMEVRDVEFPHYDKKIKSLHSRLTQVNALLYEKISEDRSLVTKRLCFKTLLDQVAQTKYSKGKGRRMFKHFLKFQIYHAFRRYHKQVSWEIAIKDKSKIEGAYLLLKRFKNRLKNYDIALERVE